MSKIIFLTVMFFYFAISIFGDPVLIKVGQTKQIQDSIRLLDSLSFLNRVSNTGLSIIYARKELSFAKISANPATLCKAYVALGTAYSTGQKDSSLYYYNLALKVSDNFNLLAQRPQLMYNLAMISLDANDFKNAIILLDSCTQLSKQLLQYPLLSDAYNSLGLIQIELNDSMSARLSFNKALEIARKYSLPKQIGNSLGNLAIFEKDIKRSISIQKEAIHYLDQQPGTDEEKALILINIGTNQSDPDSSLYYFNTAITLSIKGNLPLDEIAAYNNMANKYLQKGNVLKANECIIEKALPIAQRLNNLDWISTLYDTYADVMAESGNNKQAFKYERFSMDMKTQYNAIKAADQMRLLSSLLDLKNKELIIQNEASEIQVKNSQNRTLKLELTISVLLVLIILFVFLWFQQKSRMKIKQQQIFSARRLIEFEEAEKGKIGFELHDTIGYLLRIIENSIHSIEFPDLEIKESIRKQLTDMGETIRRISHRMNPIRQENSTFQELFADIVNDMKNLTGMKIKYFIPDYIPVLSKEIMLHFCRITEELLTNSSKYAKDSSISIQIASVENRLLLLYSDDGKGFDFSSAGESGIGLNSIFARATLLNGKAILKTKPGKGTSWDISIPL
jgi:signal transduction histidine kinase